MELSIDPLFLATIIEIVLVDVETNPLISPTILALKLGSAAFLRQMPHRWCQVELKWSRSFVGANHATLSGMALCSSRVFLSSRIGGHETDNPCGQTMGHGGLIALVSWATPLNRWLCEALPLSLSLSCDEDCCIGPDDFSAFGLAAMTEAVSK